MLDDDDDVSDRPVALVTGASRGVGAAVAERLAGDGWRVACAARSTRARPHRTPGTLDEVVDRIGAAGGEAVAVPTDLSDAGQVRAMVATTVERFGRLDALVNNAAITFPGDLDLGDDRWRLVMDVDLRAPVLAIQAARPHLAAAGGGRVVNVSSVAALAPVRGLLAYGMAKLALEKSTVDLATSLRGDGIAVNCFRIDVPVASEGFVANAPGLDRTDWEPTAVAAEGIAWMLAQPVSYTGQRESMYWLREREGIMASRSERPFTTYVPPRELADRL